jgi:hypothetical protein
MNLDIFPQLIPIAERMTWTAREVLRDIDSMPHLFNRITLTGPIFPQRALEPIVTVGEVMATFVKVSEDGLTANAYFDHPLPTTGVIEFGFEDGVLYRFPRQFNNRKITVLDRKRLPNKVRLNW